MTNAELATKLRMLAYLVDAVNSSAPSLTATFEFRRILADINREDFIRLAEAIEKQDDKP